MFAHFGILQLALEQTHPQINLSSQQQCAIMNQKRLKYYLILGFHTASLPVPPNALYNAISL
jgi:hypothetical protein